MQQIVKQLVSRSYAAYIREKIDDTRTFDDPGHYGVNVTVHEDHGTAHVTVVGPDGDAVVATTTVNQYFGSLIMSPQTGIILNDEMDDFSSRNITNYFGLPPSQKNLIHPGKRPMSSMCPAIVVDSDGDVRLAVGANGGTQITTSVAQAIVRNLFLKEDIKKTIDAPRFHHQLLPNYIEYETLFPQSTLEDLRKMGHKTHVLGSKMVGILMGIARGEDGLLYANSDYRKGGNVDGF
ncbi:scoloptoxin SSD20-like [Uloborus diversus]|uniref:scoloptoxin SSD20-like n=1 Tax=Uloborus diversus TaxID=327109 RepID=UPI00240987DF|nr:scoloptoxin SSD20-like [Uloborus diversus]